MTGALKSDGGRIHFDCLGRECFCVGQAVKCLLILSFFSFWTSKPWCKEVPQHFAVEVRLMLAMESSSLWEEFCFPTIAGRPDAANIFRRAPTWTNKGTRKLSIALSSGWQRESWTQGDPKFVTCDHSGDAQGWQIKMAQESGWNTGCSGYLLPGKQGCCALHILSSRLQGRASWSS